jgi:hypothetical protein
LSWSWFAIPLGIGIATLSSSSCIQIGPDAPSEGGADAGPSTTVQDQCTTIVTEFCSRAQDCYSQDPESCTETGVEQCCQQACMKPATSTEKSIDTCVADLKAASCDNIAAASIDSTQMPSSCQNVVKY